MIDVTPERGEGLKPCPFCGGPATMTDGMGEHWVLCRPCGANGTATSKQSAAIAAWNARPAPSPVTDEVVGVLRRLFNACLARDFNERWDEYQEARSLLAKLEVIQKPVSGDQSDAREYMKRIEALQAERASLVADLGEHRVTADLMLASLRAEMEDARAESDRWRLRVSDIRETSGLGAGPMLDELPDAIRAKIEALRAEVEKLSAAPPASVGREEIVRIITRAMCDGQGDADIINLAADDILAALAPTPPEGER